MRVKAFGNSIKILFPSVVIVCTLNSVGDSQFNIYAGYEALQYGFITQIHSQGAFPYKHDINTAFRGHIKICHIEGSHAREIKLTLYDDGKILSEIPGSEEKGIDLCNWSTEQKNLENYLKMAGYTQIDSAGSKTRKFSDG